ncbi:type 1 glutamine amidotransferase domain-containing protein [Glaciecola sp. 1036]|uniref:type 1 glutamine amidotransferase domain-containing protein n=1 Tax=Alteromonadaceae TaxID=72275 RepID=UPI003D01180B
MKQLRAILVLFSFFASLFASLQTDASDHKHILMVLSSHGKEQGKVAPGYEFDEFSKAYLIFKQNNIQVTVASPAGGEVEADKFDPETEFNAQVLADSAIMKQLENTLATAQVDAEAYDGVFIVGGKGAMFDLPKDQALQRLIAQIYTSQGTVAAVCHGPAALVDVQLPNGKFLVDGKAVNGFTNQEEKLFGKKWAKEFDFLLENKLIERGGKFESSPIMLNHVVTDQRLITGQNPTSTVAVAVELLKSMGVTPNEVPQYKDDITLDLVAEILNGDQEAKALLASKPELYHIELVAMYGYYYLMLAEQENELENALTLMQLGQKAVKNPQLDIQIATVQHKLGKKAEASKTLNQIISEHPDFEPAKEMLKTL